MEEIRLCYTDGETLMSKEHTPRPFCIKGLLPQGVCLLAGNPKSGKSWLVLDWSLCISKGIPVWGMETVQGTVLYLCLEDTEDRLRERLSLMTDEVPKSICFVTESGTLADTLEEQIHFFMREHPDTVLIVIDTFQLIRENTGEPNYAGDYQEIQKLKRIADQYRITILLVHHLRKQGDTDPFNRLSGTTGITGAADNLFILDRKDRRQSDAQLICTGRDIGDRVVHMRFSRECYVWTMISDSAETPEVILPAELNALVRYIKEVEHFLGGNQELCQRIMESTGVSATPKGLKQKMNVWRQALAEMGVVFESRKANGERTVEVHYESQGTQVAQRAQDGAP